MLKCSQSSILGGKLFADIAEYIDDHYVDAHTDTRRERLRGSFGL